MKLSAPIFQLKRRAKLMARNSNVPLNVALDQIAREEGFARWSVLSAQRAAGRLSETILSRLADGDLLLLEGRPGHGKIMLGLQLLLDAACDDRKSVLFTLEFSQQQARKQIRSLEKDAPSAADKLEIVATDEISADYIIRHLSESEPGTVAVIDDLQILDQQRSKLGLCEQVLALGDFARKTGIIFGFISQFDPPFDPESKRLPDIRDIRLPNLVDLGLFTKACFLYNGEAQLQNVA